MIKLIQYSDEYKTQILGRITEFYSYHASLLTDKHEHTTASLDSEQQTMQGWLTQDHALYLIAYENAIVGFLHLHYRGDNVAWIEDIYVDPEYRLRGIATAAITCAEDIVKANPGYSALCMDVVPRNGNALRLYHRLGYDSIGMITLRKELYDNRRDRTEPFLGLDFKI